MEYLQSREMELGFSMMYTTDQQSNLPENIRTICILDNSEEAHLLLEEGERKNLRFEVQHTEGIPLEKMARALSPLIQNSWKWKNDGSPIVLIKVLPFRLVQRQKMILQN